MLSLNTRVDGYRFRFPKTFLAEQLRDKYGEILSQQRGFFTDPVEFLNESIKNVEILGFNNGTIEQKQTATGLNYFTERGINQNAFKHTSSDISYRNPESPLALVDKTLVVRFRHTLGYLNYFMLFENFFYQYQRDYDKEELRNVFNVELISLDGAIISKVILEDPLIFGIESLSFDYAQPISENKEFTVTFKYSNFDYQFIGSIEEKYS